MEHVHAIGIGEFRANLHKYTSEVTHPLAITSHGRPIGYYIPVSPPVPTKDALQNLVAASHKMSDFLEEIGMTEDEVVAEFERLRKQDRKGK